MKLSRQDARNIAKGFRAGRGRAWKWTTLHDEIVDAEIMDAVRRSWIADSTTSVTPADLMAFRDLVEDELGKAGYMTTRYQDSVTSRSEVKP